MRITTWALTASMLVAQASLAATSALLHMPSYKKSDNLRVLMKKASMHYEGDLERRSPQTTPSSEGGMSLSTPVTEQNVSTSDACLSAMQGKSSVTNQAGFAACYNILDFHENIGGAFQADLRLYQMSAATGQFQNVPMNEITVELIYPNSTQFSILMNSKRSLSSLRGRQNTNQPTQIQQYSLVGGFKMQLDTKKLTSTQLMSLLIPEIQLWAVANGTTVSTDIAPTDTMYFVAGQFKDEATPQLAIQAADPSMAAAAIAASKGFVLPGRTLGIFPTGLIVTGAWTVFFFLAFGLGTLGRIRHRNIYRKRMAANSRMGKR